MTAKRRYTIRKQSSGYTASVKYYVYDTVSKGRVSVRAFRLRESAQKSADSLNILESMPDASIDPRSFDERYAEAEAKYYTGTAS